MGSQVMQRANLVSKGGIVDDALFDRAIAKSPGRFLDLKALQKVESSVLLCLSKIEPAISQKVGH